MSDSDPLDLFLPEAARVWLEQRFYARVNTQARFDQLIADPAFWNDPAKHVGLFSDHGVVHVRDVARRIPDVLERVHGVLIPSRPAQRLDTFMKGYGVVLAYLHDIGMADFSAFGRAMHPEFAAQAVFTPEFDDLIQILWTENRGNVACRLTSLARAGALDQPPETVFRELLALACAHSKSKVPIAILNHPPSLRSRLQMILSTDLHDLWRRQLADGRRPAPAVPAVPAARPVLERCYTDFAREAFSWLVDARPEVVELADDVRDTVRTLRCADALRQRGTVQKTSGGYEVFVSQQTGNAMYALRLGDDRLYLLELPDPFSAGEANIASSELTGAGDLRLAFHRGAFASDAALEHAVDFAAWTVADIQADVIDSFRRPAGRKAAAKDATEIQILLESVDDNPAFTHLVQARVQALDPGLAAHIETVPSLQAAADLERSRYLEAREVNWDLTRRQAILDRLAQSGHKAQRVDPQAAFRHARLATLRPGETLVEAGAPASFVYVPLGDGLQVRPLGGYPPFAVRAWMPLGSTGVIRGAARNADVVSEREVTVLVIPKEVYLRHWHYPYTAEELKQLLAAPIENQHASGF